MLFAWIVISFLTFKFLPWWGIFPVFALVGAWRPSKWTNDMLLGLVSGIVFAVMCFWADGKSGAIISQRMSGLFNLPKQDLIFALMFLLQFISSIFALQTGAALRKLFSRQTV